MRAEGRLALALVAAAVVTGPARAADVAFVERAAADVAPVERAARDVATVASREALLEQQADVALAGARWRARALYRLVVAGDALAPDTRARAIDAGARALARDLDEARMLRAARDQVRAERAALDAAARVEEVIGAPPAFAPPVPGAVLARFGVAPEPVTGVLVGHAGVRLAAPPGSPVRAPAAGTIARVAASGSTTIMLDHGAGWTTIVGGLAQADVQPGARVAAGQRLGAAAGGPAAVTFEIWRGRRAVDPLLLVRPAATALAAPARLP